MPDPNTPVPDPIPDTRLARLSDDIQDRVLGDHEPIPPARQRADLAALIRDYPDIHPTAIALFYQLAVRPPHRAMLEDPE